MSTGVGIYLGRKNVVGARIESVSGKLTLKSWTIEALTDSPVPEVVEIEKTSWKTFFQPAKPTAESLSIQKLLVKMGLNASFAGVAISPAHLVTRHFIMPELPPKEKDEAVKYEASRHTRFKLSDSVFGYCENGKTDKAVSVTANAVKKRVIQSTIMHLRRGNVEPLWIEPDYCAFARAAHLFGFTEAPEVAYALLWFEDDGGVNLTLISKGIVFLSQDFRLVGDIPADQEKIQDEMQASMRYLSETAGGIRPQFIYVGGFTDIPTWKAVLSGLFPQIEVRHVDFAGTWGVPEDQEGALVVAIGLAMGAAGIKSPVGKSDLLPPDDRKLTPQQLRMWGGAAAAAVFVALFLIHSLILSPIVQSARRDKAMAERPLAAFGALGQEPLDSLTIKQENLRGRLRVLKSFFDHRLPVHNMMTALISQLPQEIWLDEIDFSVSVADKKSGESSGKDRTQKDYYLLKLRGSCYKGSSEIEGRMINDWVQKIAQSDVMKKFFSNFSLEELKQQQQKGKTVTRFSILIESKV